MKLYLFTNNNLYDRIHIANKIDRLSQKGIDKMRYSQKYIEEIKAKIPEIAFGLFAEKGIETVSMQNIADACNLGVATLYRYYGTKLRLVVHICALKWSQFGVEAIRVYDEMEGEKWNAAEELEFYINSYIVLYKDYKPLLKFNNNFENYILHEKPSAEEMEPYYKAVSVFNDKFHKQYVEKALKDHTVRTDIPEKSVYFGIMYSMISTATKYAQGTLYKKELKFDYLKALEMQKNAYMDYMTDPRALK